MTKAKKATPDKGSAEFDALVARFTLLLKPFGLKGGPPALVDNRTGARYAEFHVRAASLIKYGTTDYPLDPDEQSEYRANRELVVNAPAFEKMCDDALNRRTFSNIVCEFTEGFEPEVPLKVIGGQHRFEAIKKALAQNVDCLHGIKVYFDLDKAQRLDVQLISNTSVAISGDLFDRMQETMRGPQLRDWCQATGLLAQGQDFADKRVRGGPISVQLARTFILNYFAGKKISPAKFAHSETAPIICPSGGETHEWDQLLKSSPKLFEDKGLRKAGEEFLRLRDAQRKAFKGSGAKPDFPDKAMNPALLAAWAFVAGVVSQDDQRAKRHYGLADATGGDPLRASVLAKARHKTDPENYRGLGYRSDAKERGRFTELFYGQTDKGEGINKPLIDVAMTRYHAKEAMLDVRRAEAKAAS